MIDNLLLYMTYTLNTYFDHVFVITLDRAKNRQQEIIKELNKYNIGFSFIDGVDGHQLDIETLENQNIYNKKQNFEKTKMLMTKGEIGCALSVLKICNKVVEENLNSVLILQDDIRILSENWNHCSQLLANVPENWDLIYLGHSQMYMKTPLHIKLRINFIYPLLNIVYRNKYKINEIRNSFRRPYSKEWYLAGQHNGGYAYGINNIGAKKLIDAFTPVFAPDDLTFRYLIKKGKLKAYSPKWQIFEQRWDLESLIGQRPAWRS